MIEDSFPYIPSEILEPHLTKFFNYMITVIGNERRFPSRAKWTAWHNMFKGVHYLVIGNRSRDSSNCVGVHANLAYGNFLGKIDPCWACSSSGGFDKQRAMEIWKTCRDVCCRKV